MKTSDQFKFTAFDFCEAVQKSKSKYGDLSESTARRWILKAKKLGICYDAVSGLGIKLDDGSKGIVAGETASERLSNIVKALGY